MCFTQLNGVFSSAGPYSTNLSKSILQPHCEHVLCTSHTTLLLQEPSGQQGMYNKLRRRDYWFHIANTVYHTIVKCESCVRNESRYRHKQPIHLFQAFESNNLIAVDVLQLLPKSSQSNRNTLIIMDQYSKQTRAIPMFATSLAHMANIFLNYWTVFFLHLHVPPDR